MSSNFDIAFVASEPELDEEGILRLRGRIVLDAYAETFFAPILLWSRERIEQQWHEAACRVLGTEAAGAFFTVPFQFWWVAWRIDDTIFLQERLLLADALERLTDSSRAPYELIAPRCTHSDEGERISEWSVSTEAMARFIDRARRNA
jgi:hypothetical protein